MVTRWNYRREGPEPLLHLAMLLLVAFSFLALLPRRGLAQDSTARARHDTTALSQRSRILRVIDASTGKPVADAKVSDAGTGATAQTDTAGQVALTFLPDGASQLRVQKVGYTAQTVALTIAPADTAATTIMLTPVATLPGVTTRGTAHYISPLLRAFEERRLHSGSGRFITDSVLRKDDNRPFANVLRAHLTGINIVQRGRFELLEPGPSCQTEFERGTPPPPDVYIDGVRMEHPPAPPNRRFTTGGVEPFDLGEFSVAEYAGVEWYPDASMAPPRFSHTSNACGILLLWTRGK